MMKPKQRLSNMEIDEISLVDKGANQHAMITIAKRATEEETMPELYTEDGQLLDQDALQHGDIVFDDEGQAWQYTLDDEDVENDDRELEEVGKAFAAGAGGTTRLAGDLVRSTTKGGKGAAHEFRQGLKGYTVHDGSVANRTGGHLGRNKKAYGFSTAAGAAGGAAGYKVKKSFSEQVMEELSKSYSDEDRDKVISKALGKVEELEQRYAEAEEIAKSERDLRLTREYISKAAEYNLPVDPAELGPVLYRMAEQMDYNDCAVIAKCLESAGEMLFQEVGFQGGGANDDIMSQVETRAVEIGKSAGSAADIASVFDSSPEAYDQYLAAKRGL